jgi:RimJ/RimL family protein N-acetyltransferase
VCAGGTAATVGDRCLTGPVPVPLTTARLTLLPWSLATDAHKDALVAAWDDPEVWRYVGAGRDRFTRADLDRGYARAERLGLLDSELVVVRTVDGAVLGVCGLYPSWFDDGDPDDTDLGYRYGRAAWGQGYGYEAAAEVMRWAVEERGLDRIGSSAQPGNIASHRILQRLGFRFVDTRPVPADPSRTADWYVWTA